MRTGAGRYFGTEEPDALVVLLLQAVAVRLPDSRPRAIANGLLAEAAEALVGGDRPDAGADLSVYAWLCARTALGVPADASDHRLAALLTRVGDGRAGQGLLGPAARCLAVALALRSPGVATPRELDGAVERLSAQTLAGTQATTRGVRTARQLALDRTRRSAVGLGMASRLAWLTARAGRVLDAEPLIDAARDLVEAVAGAGAAPAGDDDRQLPLSAHLAQFAVAAEEAGAAEHAAAARRVLDGERLVVDSHLVRASPASGGKLEFSPWIPLAFVSQLQGTGSIERVLDPTAGSLPTYRFAQIQPSAHGLAYGIDDGTRTQWRTFDFADLDLLLDRALATCERMPDANQSPRVHAHRIIALEALRAACDPGRTRTSVEALAERSLAYVLAEQRDDGGWPYSYQDKPSHVYSPAGLTTTTFPDHQYTIDAAVPGIALALSYERTGRPECLEAALGALRFFEEVIGRVEWQGKRLWRLYPDDDKTVGQGTAVNYELWNAYFFAALARAAPDHEAAPRLRTYVDDAIAYAAGHMTSDGDIAYGDYVGELRTAYSAWDAYLLAEIGRTTGSPRPRELAGLLVRRLDDLLLGSGVMPNVADYAEELDGVRRWVVHRHGIGPYPVRGDYQLYHVIAAGTAGAAPEGALASLGFVLTALYEPGYGGLGTGYYRGTGEFDERAGGVSARDWLLHSLALLDGMTQIGYRPDRTNGRTAPERLLRLLEATYEDVVDREPSTDDPGAADVDAWLARGAVTLYRATGEERWRSRALGHVSPSPPVAYEAAHLLLDLHELDGDPARRSRALAMLPELDRRDALGAGLELAVRLGCDDVPERLGRVLERQSAEGLWVDGHAETLLAVLRATRDGRGGRGAKAAIRAAADGAWSTRFTPGGRGGGDAETMPPDDVLLHVLAFRSCARRLGTRRHWEHAHRALRFLLHYQRLPFGVIGATRDARASAPVQARTFSRLATLYRLEPDFLDKPPLAAG